MKYTNLLLIMALIVPSLHAINSQQIIDTLNKQKNNFITSVTEFAQCIKGDKNCDSKKVTIYRAGLAIVGVLTITGLTTYIYRNQLLGYPTRPATTDFEQKNINRALGDAVRHGHIKQVKNMINLKADVNATDNDGYTPLFYAKNTATAKILLKKGATIDHQNNLGYTPLMKAAAEGNEEMVHFLYNKGANINARDNYGKTALNKAEAGKAIAENVSVNEEDVTKYNKIIEFLMERKKREANLKEVFNFIEEQNK